MRIFTKGARKRSMGFSQRIRGRYISLVIAFLCLGQEGRGQEGNRKGENEAEKGVLVLIEALGSPVALPEDINSILDDTTPVLQGRQLYFSRPRYPDNMGGLADKADIWMAERLPDGRWTQALNAGLPLNSEYMNQLIGLSNEGKYLWMSYEKQSPSDTRKEVRRATWVEGGWHAPQAISIPYFHNASERQGGWISAEGKVLLLSMEGYDSYGNEDIYLSFQESENEWHTPINLGSRINSRFEELNPFYIEEMDILVFASNRPEGKGSWDLYASKRLDDSWKAWGEPQNIESLNGAGSELGFYTYEDNTKAFLVRRGNSTTYSNIFSVDIRIAGQAFPLEDTLSSTRTNASSSASPQGILRVQTAQSYRAIHLHLPKKKDTLLSLDEKSLSARLFLPYGRHTLMASAKGFIPQRKEVDNYRYAFHMASADGSAARRGSVDRKYLLRARKCDLSWGSGGNVCANFKYFER